MSQENLKYILLLISLGVTTLSVFYSVVDYRRHKRILQFYRAEVLELNMKLIAMAMKSGIEVRED